MQTRYNLPIEIFYTIAPIMMVIVFFYFTVETQNEVAQRRPGPRPERHGRRPAVVMDLQLQPRVRRREGGLRAGRRRREVVHEGGTTADRPTLWLVKDQSVTFNLGSPDVIHSFWVPGFLFKMDVVPGRDNPFTLTPTRSGTFEGRCAELCGVYHSRMLFNVKVVDQAEYDAHLEELAEQGNTGPATGGVHDRGERPAWSPKKALEEKSDRRLRRPHGHTRRTPRSPRWVSSSCGS